MSALDRLDARLVPGLVRRPEIVLFLIGLLVVAGGAARLHLAGAEQQEVARTPQALHTTPTSGAAVPPGPRAGTDVEDYVRARHQALAVLADGEPRARAAAVVSFDAYLTPAEAVAAAAHSRIEVVGGRYRLAAHDPFADAGVAALARGRVELQERPEAELVRALEAEAAAAREQAAALQEMIETTDDTEFAETFVEDRDRLMAAAELVGADGCACVYALEVVGRAGDLADLADVGSVRLVDPVPPETSTASYPAILPEQRGRMRDPAL